MSEVPTGKGAKGRGVSRVYWGPLENSVPDFHFKIYTDPTFNSKNLGRERKKIKHSKLFTTL